MSSPPTTQASRSINYNQTAELLAELSNGFQGDRPRSELFVAEFLRDLHGGEYPSILVRRGDKTLRPLSTLLPNPLHFGEGSVYQKILQDLEWFQGAELELKYVFGTGYEGMSSQLDLHFDLAWLDLKVNTARPIRVAPTALRELRDQIVTALSVARTIADRATIEERCVLLVTIDGAAYKVPDLTVLGPSKQQSEQSDDDSRTINIVHLPLSEIATKGAQKEDFANELNNALGALSRSGEGWKEVFKYSLATLTEVRTQFRRKLQGHLQDTMALFEETRQQEAADDELGVLRQAASFIAFRMMFLLELERRGRLYRRGPAVATLGTEQITRTLADELAYRSDELWDANAGPKGALLARLTHSSRAIRGQIKDPHMAITGASIFANKPPNFDPRIEDWLHAVEALVDDGQDKDLLYRWDLQLQRLGSVMLGHLDDEYRSELNLIGSGAHRHRHRVLGTIYEQILAMTPKRDKTGTIRLVLGKTKGKKKDDRSALGAHYTPAALVEEVVRPTLGQLFRQFWEQAQENPQVYARLIREMTLVDPAMGSAHFLTVSALEIARELAWVKFFNEPRFITLGSEEKPWDEPLLHKNAIGADPEPKEGEEQERQDDIFYGDQDQAAKFERIVQAELPGVIQRSIYGVDINPLAAELGKLSLWLFEVQERAEDQVDEFPELTYLDSNIRVGDALVGVMLEDVEETVKNAQRTPSAQQTLFGLQKQRSTIEEELEKLSQLRQAFRTTPESPEEFKTWAQGALDRMLLQELKFDEVTSTYARHAQLDHLLREKLQDLSWLFDLTLIIKYVGYTSGSRGGRVNELYQALFNQNAPKKKDAEIKDIIEDALQTLFDDPTSEDAQVFQQNLKDWIGAQEVLNVFHWELEFPHIFNKKDGFDAIVANPPFIGSQRLRAHLGPQLQSYLGDYYFDGSTPEYAAFFFARYTQILNDEAVFSSLAPNTIAQGRIRRAALLPLLQPPSLMKSFELIRTCNSRKWPGDASVYIALVTATRKSASSSNKRLVYVDWASDDTGETLHAEMLGEGKSISSFLDILPDYDLGVIHSTKTLSSLQYYDSQRPLVITGFNIQSGFKRSLSFAEKIPLEEQDCVFAYYNNSVVKNQPVPQAKELVIDFTDALRRAGLYQRPGSEQEAWLAKSYKFLFSSLSKTIENKTGEWWKLERDRLHLRDAWSGVDQVIVFGDVSKCWTPQIIDKFDKRTGLEIRPTIQLYVIPSASLATLGIITSAVFENHLRRMSATLETRLRANPSETFPTFPMPWDSTWSHEEKRPVLSTAPADIKGLIAPAIQNILRLREQLLASPPQYFLETNASDWGITKLYNNFDNPKVKGAEIDELRKAHRDLLDAVATAYGWTHIVGKEWSFDRPWLDGTYRYVPAESIRQQFPLLIEKENIRRQRQESCLICQQIVPLLPQKGLTMQEVLALPLVKSMPIPTSDSEVLKPILESGLEQGVVGYSYGRWVPL